MSPTRVETDDCIVSGFLDNSPEAVAKVAGWVRQIADHHAWGFEAPEDMVQTTLLILVRNFQEGRFEPGNLRAYVRRIAKNVCISAYRRARSRGIEVPLTETNPTPGQLTARGVDPERMALLGRILEQLDEACRQLMRLAYLENLSRREIAVLLGITEGAAKVRLFRCLERARATLGAAGGGP